MGDALKPLPPSRLVALAADDQRMDISIFGSCRCTPASYFLGFLEHYDGR